MLGQISLVAEQQHSLKKCLELAKAEALAEFDSVGFLERLAVCLDEARALERHKVCIGMRCNWHACHQLEVQLPS